MKTFAIFPLLTVCCLVVTPVVGQDSDVPAKPTPWNVENFSGLKFRSIGPAFMSGRIADIAISPSNDNVWFVAAGSGGVWKTTNAGVTWTPVFDEQPSYSIGCVTVDPNNPHTVWVGTGENVGGRHIGFGDGIYRSVDGGEHWQSMGLNKTEHISKIIVHPNDPETLYVAAQGPLWSAGGERGFYRSTDGGKSWQRTLGDDHWTGVTDIAIDPRNPNRIYAATWEHYRSVAAYVGGGPGTALYRSEDGGQTWQQLSHGLPTSSMGKIGLAVSPQQPDTVYAAIELKRRTGGVYRSDDRGQTWEKQSETVSGGTGPHYYQELYACPHQFDRIYLMDVRMQVSNDGGKTFRKVQENHKHSDNHALAFRDDDPDYLLCGSDGGLYESFDRARHWRFIDNLPLTQFYKIALDDSAPFFNIYGGTQDNSTEGGPSRTDNVQGIQNSDWRVVLDWDGHQPATEPGNPDIVYAERQQGFLARIDMTTGEIVDIQPQADAGEEHERFNWDAPILISPHDPKRLYVGSQRVWRSDNRGDQWSAISADLTKNQNRFELPIGGKVQGWDSAWDVLAMSTFNTITSLAESPLKEGLLYAATDDGLIQVSENGGETWQKIDVGSLPGVPAAAFVNDIRADLFDTDTVYVALDDHKSGDYRPYLLKSDDRGKTWHSITSNLPQRLLVWRLVQDHVQKDLLFAATEFGIYFSINGGQVWTQLKGGLPTISFRDIHIHRRENDLVGASFGRGIYILDDLTPLRELAANTWESPATLFSVRRAWWYFPRPHLGFNGARGDQGGGHFVAPNPPFGAVFTYYLNEDVSTIEEQRQRAERQWRDEKQSIEFPGWEAVETERRESEPKIWLVVRDTDGNVVRRLTGPRKKGFHRVAWDLKYPTPNAVKWIADPPPEWGGPPTGLMAAPGVFTVALIQQIGDQVTPLGTAQEFVVEPLRKGALVGASPSEVAVFWREYEQAVRAHTAMKIALANTMTRMERMGEVMLQSRADVGELDMRRTQLREQLFKLDQQLNGNRSKQQPGEKHRPIIEERLFAVARGIDRSTYGPTATHRKMLKIAQQEMDELDGPIRAARDAISILAESLQRAGGPWIEGEDLIDR